MAAVADVARSWLPGEANHGEEPTLAVSLGFGFAGGTVAACKWLLGTREEEKVEKRRAALAGHGQTGSRILEAVWP